jgi:hypothetical protein
MILLAALLLPGLALAQTATRTTFTVQKTFSDGNSIQDVTVNIQCFTGLPLNQSQTVNPDNAGEFEVEFVVESFTDGVLDCDIWEDDVTGYTGSYSASSQATQEYGSDEDGCHFDNVTSGAHEGNDNVCEITNDPNPVEVYVTKDWVIDGEGGDQLDPSYWLDLWCYNGTIVGGEDYGYSFKSLYNGSSNGTDDVTYTAHVIPNWDGGAECYAEEGAYDSSVEVDQADCYNNGFVVEIGDADGANGCTITNTVFYEGIPTLSQYGMAILALMMLGVGFVGFRRFV